MLEVRIQKKLGAFQLDLEFSTSQPGVIALYGPSGCGKTSVVHVLAGLETPDDGLIRLNGETLFDSGARRDVPAESRGIGCVFQDARLFPHFTVRGNLLYGADRSKRAAYIDADEVIALLNLGSLLDRRPHRLSGGEKQRVAIGRALLSQPRLLLLDEPLASLDAERRREVLPYLEALRNRLAIPMVYVSHQFEEVLRLATEVILMREGRIDARGDLATMSLNPAFHQLIEADQVGAIITGELKSADRVSGLSRIRIGAGELALQVQEPADARYVRVQLLARDIIVATERPTHMSVRNCLDGTIVGIDAAQPASDLISIDIGAGVSILARITKMATRELQLRPGMRVWALVKTVSVQGHSFAAPMPPQWFTGG